MKKLVVGAMLALTTVLAVARPTAQVQTTDKQYQITLYDEKRHCQDGWLYFERQELFGKLQIVRGCWKDVDIQDIWLEDEKGKKGYLPKAAFGPLKTI